MPATQPAEAGLGLTSVSTSVAARTAVALSASWNEGYIARRDGITHASAPRTILIGKLVVLSISCCVRLCAGLASRLGIAHWPQGDSEARDALRSAWPIRLVVAMNSITTATRNKKRNPDTGSADRCCRRAGRQWRRARRLAQALA